MLSHKCTERQQEKSGTAHLYLACPGGTVVHVLYSELWLLYTTNARLPKLPRYVLIRNKQRRPMPPNTPTLNRRSAQAVAHIRRKEKAFEGQTRTYTLSLEDPTGTIMCNSPSHTPPLKISIDIDPFPLVNRVIPSHHHS
jgi:hypothetical protein